MYGLLGAATVHRDSFYAMLDEVGIPVTIRQPAEKPSSGGSDVTKALGTREQVTGTGEEKEVLAIVSGPTNTGVNITAGTAPKQASPVGSVQFCSTVLRVKLSDVLVNEEKLYGKTLFETAREIVIQDTVFKVVATERSGLAPLGPYILWVGAEVK